MSPHISNGTRLVLPELLAHTDIVCYHLLYVVEVPVRPAEASDQYEGTVLLDTRGIYNQGAGVQSDGQGITGQSDYPSSVEAYASREP